MRGRMTGVALIARSINLHFLCDRFEPSIAYHYHRREQDRSSSVVSVVVVVPEPVPLRWSPSEQNARQKWPKIYVENLIIRSGDSGEYSRERPVQVKREREGAF